MYLLYSEIRECRLEARYDFVGRNYKSYLTSNNLVIVIFSEVWCDCFDFTDFFFKNRSILPDLASTLYSIPVFQKNMFWNIQNLLSTNVFALKLLKHFVMRK